jgi:hypothetical protein
MGLLCNVPAESTHKGFFINIIHKKNIKKPKIGVHL